MPHQKITQALVDGLPFQDSGTHWVHDTDLAGFNLSVGRRTKTYYAAGEAGGRFIRVKIGRADVTKANEARAVARDILLPEIRRGVDPRAKQLGDEDRTYGVDWYDNRKLRRQRAIYNAIVMQLIRLMS